MYKLHHMIHIHRDLRCAVVWQQFNHFLVAELFSVLLNKNDRYWCYFKGTPNGGSQAFQHRNSSCINWCSKKRCSNLFVDCSYLSTFQFAFAAEQRSAGMNANRQISHRFGYFIDHVCSMASAKWYSTFAACNKRGFHALPITLTLTKCQCLPMYINKRKFTIAAVFCKTLMQICHFRVAFCLFVKTSLPVKPLIWIWIPRTGSLWRQSNSDSFSNNHQPGRPCKRHHILPQTPAADLGQLVRL